MILTLQVQLDPECIADMFKDKEIKTEFTEIELYKIYAEFMELCHNLEKLSYLRADMYVDGKQWNPK